MTWLKTCFGGYAMLKYLAMLLAIVCLWADGTYWLAAGMTVLLVGFPLGALALALLRQRQTLSCSPGLVHVRSWRGQERMIDAWDVGAVRWTADRLLLRDRVGGRLGAVSRTDWQRKTAGLDALLALLAPGKGLTWDGKPFTVALPRWLRVWTILTAALAEGLLLAVGAFLYCTGQLDGESLGNGLFLLALLSAWSAWRLLRVLRRRLLADGDGITVVPALGAGRHIPWSRVSLTWEADGMPRLPSVPLTGWEPGLLQLLCALRDRGVLDGAWESDDLETTG